MEIIALLYVETQGEWEEKFVTLGMLLTLSV